MNEDEIVRAGVAGLPALYRAAAVSPPDVVQIYADRIAQFDAYVQAYLHLSLDAARQEAAASARRWAAEVPLSPLDGVPIAVKANIAVAGLPHHGGIAAYRDHVAEDDAAAVARLRKAGAIVLGLVNMHEGALGATTDNPGFARTHNPWRHGFTPGGSSGGSAAAVTAGLCAGALGSDTMGSVRIPSAYCGCVGLKPTPGRVPVEGVLALSYSLDHIGAHARSLDDVRALAEGLGDVSLRHADLDPARLRLGVWDGAEGVQTTDTVAAGFRAAVQRISEAGAALSPVTPPLYAYGRDRRKGLLIAEREAAAIHAEMLAQDPQGFSEDFRSLMAWGAGQSEEKAAAAYARLRELAEAAPSAFEAVDAILAPTAPQTAFAFEEPAPANQADFTAWANFAGLPAATLCTGVSAEGLPLSIQIIAAKGEDARVLAIAQALEALFGRAPLPPAFRNS